MKDNIIINAVFNKASQFTSVPTSPSTPNPGGSSNNYPSGQSSSTSNLTPPPTSGRGKKTNTNQIKNQLNKAINDAIERLNDEIKNKPLSVVPAELKTLVINFCNKLLYTIYPAKTSNSINKFLTNKFGYIKPIELDNYFKKISAPNKYNPQAAIDNLKRQIDTIITSLRNEINSLKQTGNVEIINKISEIESLILRFENELNDFIPEDVNEDHMEFIKELSIELNKVINNLENTIDISNKYLSEIQVYFSKREQSNNTSVLQQKQNFQELLVPRKQELLILLNGYKAKRIELQSLYSKQNLFNEDNINQESNYNKKNVIKNAKNVWFDFNQNKYDTNSNLFMNKYNVVINSINQIGKAMLNILKKYKVSFVKSTYDYFNKFIWNLNPVLMLQNQSQQSYSPQSMPQQSNQNSQNPQQRRSSGVNGNLNSIVEILNRFNPNTPVGDVIKQLNRKGRQ